MEHGFLLPEQVPLPESEDAFGVASFTMPENDDSAEYGTGANRPKRVRKPTAKVIRISRNRKSTRRPLEEILRSDKDFTDTRPLR